MAVYTYFGGKDDLVREIVRDGFARLDQMFGLVETTGDTVADLALLGRAYRHNGRTNPHMYGVMFGGATLEGFALTEPDRQQGRYTLTKVAEFAGRCIESGRFRRDDPVLVAHEMWIAVHGTVTLELGSYLIPPYDADRCFESQLVGLMTGAGDRLDRASESVADSARRFRAVFGADTVPALATRRSPSNNGDLRHSERVGGEFGSPHPGSDLRERGLARCRQVISEWREPAIVAGPETIGGDDAGGRHYPVAYLLRCLNPRIDRVGDADEDAGIHRSLADGDPQDLSRVALARELQVEVTGLELEQPRQQVSVTDIEAVSGIQIAPRTSMHAYACTFGIVKSLEHAIVQCDEII
jgi:AcrR family transcriptional regulator